MKLYVMNGSKSGKENLDGVYYLMTEDGEALYSHWCSNKYFAIGDLVVNYALIVDIKIQR